MSTTVNETPTEDRTPITDIEAWLASKAPITESTLRALGELLIGVVDSGRSESAERFTARHLGLENLGDVLDEERDLTTTSRLTVALALAESIVEHQGMVEIGPGGYSEPPSWTTTEVGTDTYHHPHRLRAAFPAGTVAADAPVVVEIDTRTDSLNDPTVTAHVRREDQAVARQVLDQLLERGQMLNPYRGRALRASYGRGLELSVIELPETITRDSIIASDEIWREIDLGIAAVRDQHQQLRAAGLGTRRGILLCGAPGVGKTAISTVVAKELIASGFTAIFVEAQAGAMLLTRVVEEAVKLGGGVVLILDDLDLWTSDRRKGRGGGGLSELLQAMDAAPDTARILTLASTNDASSLDPAAIRTGRLDSAVVVSPPDLAAAGRILDALLADLPGVGGVDTAAVAARLPAETSGSDIREIVRRAVLAAGGEPLSTAALLAEIGSGRYKAALPGDGRYL
ncbi:AAA family ATPase [Mycolicibacter virginiensis]|uniref:AAA family ATPase n=1 Tax=Mycolicibacter virginiensis TaxID=1795032 RepID=UPI001F03BBE3|nr:ATP-binding protein [Mycolicibacter virginiensis]ULP48007.1 ATP-binding protein [Mycolicibacter virginiensis]